MSAIDELLRVCAHGAIPVGQRLSPKVPFVLGGAFELGNLFAIDAVERMRCGAQLVRQLKGAPDGTRVKLVIE